MDKISRKKLVLRLLSNPNRANSILVPHEFPSKQEIKELDKYRIPLDVDKPLRKSVIDLNKAGFSTKGSCSGHNQTNGFITISKLLTKTEQDEVKNILNYNNIQVEKFKVNYGKLTLGKNPEIEYPSSMSVITKPIHNDYDYTKIYGDINIEKDIYGLTDEDIKRAEMVCSSTIQKEQHQPSTYKEEIDNNNQWIGIAKKAIKENDIDTKNLVALRIKTDLTAYDYLLKNKKYKNQRGKIIGTKLRNDLHNKAVAIKLI